LNFSFWLKIEQFWSFEEISIFSNGGHLGSGAALAGKILKGGHPRILSEKFGLGFLFKLPIVIVFVFL
jgi:hypothetical protein